MREDLTWIDAATGGFDPWPRHTQVHLEWGVIGAGEAARRRDLVVIIDVLSLSTTVSLAIGRGAVPLVYSPDEVEALGGRETLGPTLDAKLAAPKRSAEAGEVSLSPASTQALRPGERLILTSPNGATCVAAADRAPALLLSCLRDRQAAGHAAATLLRQGVAPRISLIACGEQWSAVAAAVGPRPGIEDWLGAGAIAQHLDALGLRLSAEARAAAAMFESCSGALPRLIHECVSGRELIDRGFGEDVALASELDVVDYCPRRIRNGIERLFAPMQV